MEGEYELVCNLSTGAIPMTLTNPDLDFKVTMFCIAK